MATNKNQGLHTPPAEAGVFIALLVFRVINSQLVQTFFQPDEYFQALEPAWQIAFGPDSGAWMTWEWREGLRTSVHPYLFAAAYKAVAHTCELVHANEHFRAAALGAAPRLLQALWAAAMDLLTWRIARKLYGSGHAASSAALALTVLSPWQWFCSTRTFSNSLEATLTALSLSSFPWSKFLETEDAQAKKHTAGSREETLSKSLYLSLTAAAAAFYLRPTNIIIWICISVCLVWYNRSVTKAIILIQAAGAVGLAVTVAFACVDRAYYGNWTFPPLRFLYFNIVQSLAVFYGRNRPDYYVTEGLPLLLTTALPFACIGLYQSLKNARAIRSSTNTLGLRTASVFASTVTMTILVLSTIAHKEMRFAYPLLPMLHVLAARPLGCMLARRSPMKASLLVAGIAVNVYIAYYVSFVHQRGVVDAMHYLRHRQESWFDASRTGEISLSTAPNITIGFLMPCHSTPWRSHLIYSETNAWALTCEPPINLPLEQRHTYMDEADIFYEDPAKWLRKNMEDLSTISTVDPGTVETSGHGDDVRRRWPHYLVAFEQLEPILTPILAESRYKECKRFFNTHWHDDRRRHGDVVVWCMRR